MHFPFIFLSCHIATVLGSGQRELHFKIHLPLYSQCFIKFSTLTLDGTHVTYIQNRTLIGSLSEIAAKGQQNDLYHLGGNIIYLPLIGCMLWIAFAYGVFFFPPRERIGKLYLSFPTQFSLWPQTGFKTIGLGLSYNLCWKKLVVLMGVRLLNFVPSIEINKWLKTHMLILFWTKWITAASVDVSII